MSRRMGPTKAKFAAIALICAILVLESTVVSSVVEDLVVEQCKHHCRLDINKRECEDRCNEEMRTNVETSRQQEEEQDPFCEAFCKPFEGLYQQCMTVCPRTIGGDGVANGYLQTKCNRKCPAYTESEAYKRCMSGCFMSMRMGNEQVCETSCSIIQEEPLTIRCTRVCHERIPGAVSTS
ncbi:hypothetical protein CARUB_v10018512mg [Capsella rubella]|uniref:Uncharacterized protein n=1 Tax=Capsella rubella TaxID=81985 RepID=R0H7C7_9BRAS|nr:uncharacterized protein LOC17887127 [Capsella rubella]EOA25199.1 hypothetical protein CARUB_v10018512mg [Capsella rubella]